MMPVKPDGEGWLFYCFVYGIPQAKGSPHIRRHGAKRTLTVHSPTCERWEQDVSRQARIHAPDVVLEGPLHLTCCFEMPRPKSVKRDKPCVKPDIDKLLRAVADAITRAGVWHDDAQVTSCWAIKSYVAEGPTGVGIYIGGDES